MNLNSSLNPINDASALESTPPPLQPEQVNQLQNIRLADVDITLEDLSQTKKPSSLTLNDVAAENPSLPLPKETPDFLQQLLDNINAVEIALKNATSIRGQGMLTMLNGLDQRMKEISQKYDDLAQKIKKLNAKKKATEKRKRWLKWGTIALAVTVAAATGGTGAGIAIAALTIAEQFGVFDKDGLLDQGLKDLGIKSETAREHWLLAIKIAVVVGLFAAGDGGMAGTSLALQGLVATNLSTEGLNSGIDHSGWKYVQKHETAFDLGFNMLLLALSCGAASLAKAAPAAEASAGAESMELEEMGSEASSAVRSENVGSPAMRGEPDDFTTASYPEEAEASANKAALKMQTNFNKFLNLMAAGEASIDSYLQYSLGSLDLDMSKITMGQTKTQHDIKISQVQIQMLQTLLEESAKKLSTQEEDASALEQSIRSILNTDQRITHLAFSNA